MKQPSAKYVNMADVSVLTPATPDRSPDRDVPSPAGEPFYDIMELLFFAYRDFVRDADALLAAYGFGRAHHRILHFVDRHPGMRVTELLDILKITKQSLGRVLRELLDRGFVTQTEGAVDRRQRLLFTTPQGAALARELAGLQDRRIAAALAHGGSAGRGDACAFLFAMVDPEERAKVAALIAGHGGGPPAPRPAVPRPAAET